MEELERQFELLSKMFSNIDKRIDLLNERVDSFNQSFATIKVKLEVMHLAVHAHVTCNEKVSIKQYYEEMLAAITAKEKGQD